jgi:hypothetical protein
VKGGMMVLYKIVEPEEVFESMYGPVDGYRFLDRERKRLLRKGRTVEVKGNVLIVNRLVGDTTVEDVAFQ